VVIHADDPTQSRPEVVIIGGGLTGLACAREFDRLGLPWRLIEASDGLGGRVRTDTVDGFRLDRGFQVLLTDYPELTRLDVLSRLDLGCFEPGALVRLEVRRGARFARLSDPWRKPLTVFDPGWIRILGLADALRLARLRHEVLADEPPPDGATTAEYLAELGFSEAALRRFFVPFFGGVLLDRELGAPASLFRHLFRHFARGDAAIPAGGMGALSTEVARSLDPGRIRLGTRVASLAGTTLVDHEGHAMTAAGIVVATDRDAARDLLPKWAGDNPSPTPSWSSTTTFWFAASSVPAAIDRPLIVLDGEGGELIHHLAVHTRVAADLAPEGQALLSVSHDGALRPDLQEAVMRTLAAWFGGGLADLRLLRIDAIDRALPRCATPFAARPGATRVAPGVVVAGDHLGDPSIDGALAAGRLAATWVAADLLGRPFEPRVPAPA